MRAVRVSALGLIVAVSLGGLGCWTSTPTADTHASGAPSAEPAAVLEAPVPIERVALPPIDDPSALTEADIDRLIVALIPHIERAAGASFSAVPAGLHGTPDALREVLRVETRQIVSRIYDVPDHVIDQLSNAASAGVPGLLGKYASSTGAVYLVPAALAAVGERQGDPAAALDAAVIILVHELAHALQDQQAQLDDVLADLQDLDHLDGFRAITEGHANWITLRVARALGREAAFWELSASQGWGPDGLITPGAFPVFMLYGQGMFFCNDHAERGGTERLWQIVREPPRTTTMVFRPERYAEPLVGPDLTGALRGVETTLTSGVDWVPADSVLGEGAIRSEVVGLPSVRVDAVLDGIVWGRERRMYTHGGTSAGPRNAAVWVVSFKTAEAARDLVHLLTEGLQAQAQARTEQERQLAEMHPGIAPRTWQVEAVPYDKVEGDAVVRRVVGPLTASGARRSIAEEQALWVVRGDELVMVTVSGFRPGNRLDRAIVQIFEQLDERTAAPASDAPPPE